MSSAEPSHEMVVEEDHSKKMEVEKQAAVVFPHTADEVESVVAAVPHPPTALVEGATNQPVTQTDTQPVSTQPADITKPSEEVAEKPKEIDQHLTKTYNYGSNEMDQFWLPGERSETRRPFLNPLLTEIIVVKVACGSLHILILSDQGRVYSSGQNDDGALGRPDETSTDKESDKKSKLVELPIRVNMISAGDSHSVAANSELGVCFQWGAYRNTEKSYLAPPTHSPVQVGQKEFQKKKFQKLLSGQQHTLVLTEEGEVFCWGDPDMGVVGRMPRTRHGYEQALKVAKVTHHKAVDIYTGGRHCFMKRLLKKSTTAADGTNTQPIFGYFAWGLNNFGQLGINLPEDENLDVVFDPIKINFFDNLDVIQITGGESHSLALALDGTLYGFGRNDIGQFGLGATKSTHPVYGKIAESYPVPIKIDTLPADAKKIVKSWSGPNYCYAQDESGQNFSWGFGCNFVLGNRKDEDEDEFTPFSIPRDFFKNEIPYSFGLGSQHVSYWVNLTDVVPFVDEKLLLDAPAEYIPAHFKPRVIKNPITALGRAQISNELSSQSNSNKESEDIENNIDKGKQEDNNEKDNVTDDHLVDQVNQDKSEKSQTNTKKKPQSRSPSSSSQKSKKTDDSRSKSKETKKKPSESKGRSKSKETKKSDPTKTKESASKKSSSRSASKKSSSRSASKKSSSRSASKSASPKSISKLSLSKSAAKPASKASNKKKPADDIDSAKNVVPKIKVDKTVSKKK